MALTYKELSLVAELHYGRLPDAFKIKATEFFDTLDLDGDGIVTLPELLTSNLEGKFGEEFIKDVFYSIDVEGKGHLDFRESLALYYICMYSGRLCHGCERNIPQGLGYTCFKCWKEGVSVMNDQSFSLCLECYSSSNYQHEHDPLHLMHDFVLFDNLLHGNKPSTPTAAPTPMRAPVRIAEQTLKQCIVCGDFHESKVRGFTCDVHMAKMRDSTEFVCEWCFSYLCSKCGHLFRDSTTRAEPGKWLQRFVCPSCHPKNISTDCYDASINKLRRVLGGVDLLKQCKTCDIKYQNGTLFWIVNGTNMAAASSTGLSGLGSHQQRQSRAPAGHVTSRSNSFDNQPHVSNFGAGNQSSYRSSSGSAFSRGSGSSNKMSYQEDEFRNGSGSSHGGAYASRAGGRGMNQFYVANEGGNMASRQGSGGYINRSAVQEDDGSSISSRSSSGGRSTGAAALGNRPSLQDTAASAVRTVNRMMDVANMAANMFGGINSIGGGSGGASGGGNGGIDAANMAPDMFNGISSGAGVSAGNGGIDASNILNSLSGGNGGIDVATIAANMYGVGATWNGADVGMIGTDTGDAVLATFNAIAGNMQ